MVLVAKQVPSSGLLGSGVIEETAVLQWSSFTDYELLPPIMAWIQPVIGRAASSPDILAKAEQNCEPTVRAIEKAIKGKQYLVGDKLTIADLFVISGLARGYQYVREAIRSLSNGEQAFTNIYYQVFTKSWAEKHPIVHEYYMRFRSDPIFTKILGDNIVLDEAGGTYPDY